MTRRVFLWAAASPFEPARVNWICSSVGSVAYNRLHWAGSQRAVNTGSLLKPFLVIAYGATHRSYPVVHCSGYRDGCWMPGGHGKQDIVDAFANSCNAYFLKVAAELDRAALDSVCERYAGRGPVLCCVRRQNSRHGRERLSLPGCRM